MDPEVTPEPQKDDENPSRVHMSSLLLFVRQSQAEHGLKHNDYTRYRHHCTRQLRKLYSGLGLQHGRGRYVKKDISPDHCFSDRHLHVLLISAERAWSTAMALKHRGQGMSSGERHYMLMRFRKAELWSRKLADAALRRYEPKIALEAEAYSSWITGNFLIETGKDMRGSLVSLLRAKAVLEELVRSRNMENLGVCKQYLEELHPKIRFCRYEMERAGNQGDQTDGDDLGSDLKALVTELQAQGEGEVRSRASSGAVFDWRGMSFPIVHEKVGARPQLCGSCLPRFDAAVLPPTGEPEHICGRRRLPKRQGNPSTAKETGEERLERKRKRGGGFRAPPPSAKYGLRVLCGFASRAKPSAGHRTVHPRATRGRCRSLTAPFSCTTRVSTRSKRLTAQASWSPRRR